MEFFSNVSAIATMILFSFYLAGRVITILSVSKIWKDKIVIGSEDYSKYDIIDEVDIVDKEKEDNLEKEDEIQGVIVSKEGIRNIKIYDVVPDEEGLMLQKGDLIYSKDFINIDQAIGIHVCTGDLFPTLIIEYITFDYMKVRIEWRDNLKSGVFGEFIRPRHTLKSFLYYFLR